MQTSIKPQKNKKNFKKFNENLATFWELFKYILFF